MHLSFGETAIILLCYDLMLMDVLGSIFNKNVEQAWDELDILVGEVELRPSFTAFKHSNGTTMIKAI